MIPIGLESMEEIFKRIGWTTLPDGSLQSPTPVGPYDRMQIHHACIRGPGDEQRRISESVYQALTCPLEDLPLLLASEMPMNILERWGFLVHHIIERRLELAI